MISAKQAQEISAYQHGYLAYVEIESMENAFKELWEPGLSISFANKSTGKFVHIFEAEYEYQLYITNL